MTQKYIIQLVNAENGARSPEMSVTHEEFIHALSIMRANETTRDEDYVLIAAMMDTENQELEFLQTPLIQVGHLLNSLQEMEEISHG